MFECVFLSIRVCLQHCVCVSPDRVLCSYMMLCGSFIVSELDVSFTLTVEVEETAAALVGTDLYRVWILSYT